MIASEASLNANGVELFHQVGKPDGVAFSATSQASWTTGTGGDWQAARFGIAAAMMRNSYYILNPGGESYNSVGLMDEMYQGGSYAWLSNGSQRLDAPQSTSWSNGVWRRRFPNGWVLWNPRGNGVKLPPRTINYSASPIAAAAMEILASTAAPRLREAP